MAQQPDLQAILATLAQYSQQSAPTQTPPLSADQTAEVHGDTSGAAANSNTLAATQNSSIGSVPTDPRLRGRPQSRSITPAHTQNNQVLPQQHSVIDPAAITVWQDGLRCVTKIAAQNKMFEASIRRMMQDQRAHEMRWYTERQTLKQAQLSRSSSAAKALLILQSLNQESTDSPVAEQSEDAKAAELAAFDRKVYNAQSSMETAMTAELKGLGVPFFGTNADLIIADDQQVTSAEGAPNHPKWSVPVTESELLALKQKMVAHLEMLYRD